MSKNFLKIKKIEDKINIGFFYSKGGVSKGNYNSLNCSLSSFDKKDNVKTNIKIAKKKLGITKKKLKLLSQIHSNKICLINRNNFKNNHFGDGMITKDKNIALGVLTADCAPIFIFDYKMSYICCLHSGWKGTLSNICGKSIKILNKKKLKSSNMIAIVGPCLAGTNFEVDKKFKLQFIKQKSTYSIFFKSKNKTKDLFYMRNLINYQLKQEGVNNIYNIRKDTYSNSRNFFSHRRASHKKQLNTGRMINIISFRD